MLHEHVITYCTARGIKSTFGGTIIDNNFLFTKSFCKPKAIGSKLGVNFRAHFKAIPVHFSVKASVVGSNEHSFEAVVRGLPVSPLRLPTFTHGSVLWLTITVCHKCSCLFNNICDLTSLVTYAKVSIFRAVAIATGGCTCFID